MSRDSDIEGLKKLVQTIQANDTKVIAQINHAGSAASSKAVLRSWARMAAVSE